MCDSVFVCVFDFPFVSFGAVFLLSGVQTACRIAYKACKRGGEAWKAGSEAIPSMNDKTPYSRQGQAQRLRGIRTKTKNNNYISCHPR